MRETTHVSTRTTTPVSTPGASDRAQLDIPRRLRRLRRSPALRAMVRETRLSPDMFLYPLFVCTGQGQRREVTSMPGVFQLSVVEVVTEAAAA
jgi:porphobilinogen synthase